MISRFCRILLAAFLLLSAAFSGALAEGTACGEAAPGSEIAHQHGQANGHHQDQADVGDDEPAAAGKFHEVLGCHSAGAGCVGCIATVAAASTISLNDRVAYALSDDAGHSIDLADSFRPPMVSL